MAQDTPTINAETRDRVGTRYAQRLRQSGRLPAVIYGHHMDPVAVSVDEKKILEALHDGAHVLNVSIEGGATETCLVKDLQFGYLGDNVIHIDLARVNLDEEVTVNVHLHHHGEPEALKQPGTILTHDLTELEVICKVRDIPEEIRIDLSNMEDAFTVGDLTLPEGVRTEVEPDTPIARIDFISEEELAEGEEAEVEGEAEEPEVITEKDEAEESEAEGGAEAEDETRE